MAIGRLNAAWTALFCSLASNAQAVSLQQLETQKLTAADASTGSFLGWPIACERGRALIGAWGDPDRSVVGAAYYWEHDGTAWREIQKLVASDADVGDAVGVGVALSSSIALIGAPGAISRAAYVFEWDGSAWNEVQKLFLGGTADFGSPVALSGQDHAFVASPHDDTYGAVYVFEGGPGLPWVETDRLLPSGPDYFFGSSLAVVGDRLVVGAGRGHCGGVSQSGIVYVFENTESGWVERQKLCPDDPVRWMEFGDFGTTVALSGERILVGAPGDPETGAAYVFERDAAGWTQTAKLLSGDAASDLFGWSVALVNDRAVIGDRRGPSGAIAPGALYVLEERGGAWSRAAKLLASDGAESDHLGYALASSGNFVLGGAPGDAHAGLIEAGSAYAFLVGVGENYCTSTPSSMGSPAVLSSTGSASVAANDLRLTATPVPNQPGIFFLGTNPVQIPFGNGFLCAATGLVRLRVSVARAHVLSMALDLGAPPLAGRLVAGSRWYAQAWFRDPAAGGAFFDTSDGLSILFEP